MHRFGILDLTTAAARTMLLVVLFSAASFADGLDAYFAKAIWLGDGATGSEILVDGVMLVEAGRIVDVGPQGEVEVPATARRHNLGSSVLIPGLVVAQTQLLQSSATDEIAIHPELRAVDGFDPFGDFQELLAAGVTCVQISPPNNRLVPGQGGVVRLAGPVEERVLESAESLEIVLTSDGLSPPTVYQPPVGAVSVERPVKPTSPQLATSLSQAVIGLDTLFATASQPDPGGFDDVALDALVQWIEKKGPVRWLASTEAEIQAALELSSKYDLPWIVVDPQYVQKLAEAETWETPLAAGVLLHPEIRPGRITNPGLPQPGRSEPLPVWERARKLIDAGAANRLAIHAGTDSDLKELMFSAGVFGRAGFSKPQILQMLTANPAKILGVADQVGSLKQGALADFVVLNGAPLSSGATVAATYVGGERVFDADEKLQRVEEPPAKLIRAGTAHTSSGPVADVEIAIVDGKIRELGADVSRPADAEYRDFSNAVVVPGFVDCGSLLGIGGRLSDRLPLGTKLGDWLAREDEQIALAREGGVTTTLLSSSRLPSPVIALKLTDEPHPLKDPVAIRFEVDGNLTASEASLRKTLQSGKAYADSWNKYDAAMDEYREKLKEYERLKREYDEAKKKAEKDKADSRKDSEDANKDEDGSKVKKANDASKSSAEDNARKESSKEEESGDKDESESQSEAKSGERKSGEESDKEANGKDASESSPKEPEKPDEPKKPRTNAALEPYRALFAKEIVALVELEEAPAVDVAIKLFRTEFDLRTGLVGGAATAMHADELAKQDVFVIVGPQFSGEEDGELVNYAASLSLAEVPFGFQSQADTGVKLLPSAVSYAVHSGLGQDAALDAFTSGPAAFLGLESIACLKPGMDADLVVWSGPPMEISSEVLAVMIDGEWVYEKDK